jgi:chromosomal replication initiation ATPase DnaA
MLDLEAEMAKALEGKFYWEPTSSPSGEKNAMQMEIYKAQKTGPRKIIKSNATIIDETEVIESFVRPRLIEEIEIQKKNVKTLDDLRRVISATYGVKVEDITRHTNKPKICEAKRHFYWAAIRCFPEYSIAEIGRQLGRNHAVIIHSRDIFERRKAEYAEQIKYVDEVMGLK